MADQPQSQHASTKSESVTKGLQVIADASPRTLVASFVVLAAVLYAVLGRVGLLLIGAVVGAVIHGTWETSYKSPGHASCIEILSSRLALIARAHIEEWQEKTLFPPTDKLPGFGTPSQQSTKQRQSRLGPASKEALEDLEHAALRNYVTLNLKGFLSFTSLEILQTPCRQSLRHLLLAVSSHISQSRTPSDAFLGVTIGISSVLVVFLKELAKALEDQTDFDVRESISTYLKHTPDSPLANILDRQEQEKKLRAVASDFLEAFLDPATKRCEPVFVLLREMLADGACQSILTTCSHPGWINEWVVYLLEGEEPEIMNAIDAEVGRVAQAEMKTSSVASLENGTTQDDVKLPFPQRQKRGDSAESEDEATKAARQEAQGLVGLVNPGSAHEFRLSDDLTASTESTDPCSTPTSTKSEWLGANSSESIVHRDESTTTRAPMAGKPDATPFTEFEQILKPVDPRSEASELRQLTLFKAKVTILNDLSQDAAILRFKPTAAEYLLQIEPLSSHYAGWIVSRKYSDFEALQGTISRIAVISGTDFPYRSLPSWKGLTQESHRTDLEAYLGCALSFMPIAESEAMWRFLKKDQAPDRMSIPSTILGFPASDTFQTIGKGVKNAFANAPKGAAGGGKALIDSVNGVFGGSKKSRPSPFRQTSLESPVSKQSLQSSNTTLASSQPSSEPSHLEKDLSDDADDAQYAGSKPPLPARTATSPRTTTGQNAVIPVETNVHNAAQEPLGAAMSPAHSGSLSRFMPDEGQDNQVCHRPSEVSLASPRGSLSSPDIESQKQYDGPSGSTGDPITRSDFGSADAIGDAEKGSDHMPLTTDETRIAIELMFTVVNELFSLTSVWSVRRTFLNAAKNYVLFVVLLVK